MRAPWGRKTFDRKWLVRVRERSKSEGWEAAVQWRWRPCGGVDAVAPIKLYSGSESRRASRLVVLLANPIQGVCFSKFGRHHEM